MDTNLTENAAAQQPDSEAMYRAIRDSVLQIYQYASKIAKEKDPDNELQVSWELGDTSLINWISFSRCYLSRNGQKLQFLSKPSRLETISYDLVEGDRVLICSDNLREKLTDNEIDEIIRESESPEIACQNLLKIANATSHEEGYNVVVMEVINNKNIVTAIPANSQDVVKPLVSSSKKSSLNWLMVLIPLLLATILGLGFWHFKSNGFNFSNPFTSKSDSANVAPLLSYIPINSESLKLAQPNDEFKEDSVKEPDIFSEKPNEISNSQKEDFKPINSPESKKPKEKTTTQNNTKETSERKEKNNSENNNSQKNALENQKVKWTMIKDSLQNEVSAGKTYLNDQLKNSKNVLKRVEEKLKDLN
jgi:hypothetical protein